MQGCGTTSMLNRVRLNASDPVRAASLALERRAADLVPGGAPAEEAPLYLRRGSGARVWDVDGNEYLDYRMESGTVCLGHAHPGVDEAVRAQLRDAAGGCGRHPLEVEVAEQVRALVPNTGVVVLGPAEAELRRTAIRLAQVATGRTAVLRCGEPGGDGAWAGLRASRLDAGDLAAAARAIDQATAGVVVEAAVLEDPAPGFLAGLRELCRRHRALLMFDEAATGFRAALGGAQQRHGVAADLAWSSRTIANGLSLAALTVAPGLPASVPGAATGARPDLLSLAAAKATLAELQDSGAPARLARLGRRLKDGYNAMAATLGLRGTAAVGPDDHPRIQFDPQWNDGGRQALRVRRELLRRGILCDGVHYFSLSHGESDVTYTLSAYRDILVLLRRTAGAPGRG